jgi:hypothetical protein
MKIICKFEIVINLTFCCIVPVYLDYILGYKGFVFIYKVRYVGSLFHAQSFITYKMITSCKCSQQCVDQTVTKDCKESNTEELELHVPSPAKTKDKHSRNPQPDVRSLLIFLDSPPNCIKVSFTHTEPHLSCERSRFWIDLSFENTYKLNGCSLLGKNTNISKHIQIRDVHIVLFKNFNEFYSSVKSKKHHYENIPLLQIFLKFR